jgi:hypothetical protein
MAPGAAPAVAAVVLFQAVHQRDPGGRLHLRIQGRAHVVAAFVQAGTQGGDAALAHLLDEIVGVAIGGAPGCGLDDQVLVHGLLGLFLGDPALLGHLAQHPVATGHRLGLVADRMVVVRPLRQRGQVGALRQGQVRQRLAEIIVGCGADAKRAVTQPDLVQIQLEDLLLGQRLLQAMSQDRFLELATDRGVAGQQDVLGDLLGDGRAAFQALAANGVADILQHGPRQARDVDAAVLEEVAILGRQEGLGQLRRDLVVGDEDPALFGILADQGAVPRIDARGRRRTVVLQLTGVGHIVEQPGGVDRDRESRDGDRRKHRHARDGHPSFGGFQLKTWPPGTPRALPAGLAGFAPGANAAGRGPAPQAVDEDQRAASRVASAK